MAPTQGASTYPISPSMSLSLTQEALQRQKRKEAMSVTTMELDDLAPFAPSEPPQIPPQPVPDLRVSIINQKGSAVLNADVYIYEGNQLDVPKYANSRSSGVVEFNSISGDIAMVIYAKGYETFHTYFTWQDPWMDMVVTLDKPSAIEGMGTSLIVIGVLVSIGLFVSLGAGLGQKVLGR